MPKLIVGFCQKIGEPNYGSRGANVVLEMEVDGPMAANNDRTRAQISALFNIARRAVAEELAHGGDAPSNSGATHSTNGSGDPPPAARNGIRSATPNQLRAIAGLAARHRVNLPEMLRQRYRANRVEDLSLTDASTLIDELKARQQANAEN